jgi:hypothetical protein
VVDVLFEEARARGPSGEAQGTGVVGEEGPLEVRHLDRDRGTAVSWRGPVRDAPEEVGCFLGPVVRVERLVDDAGEGERSAARTPSPTPPQRSFRAKLRDKKGT